MAPVDDHAAGPVEADAFAGQRQYGCVLMEGRRPRRPLRWVVLDGLLRWPVVTAAGFVGAVLGVDALGRWLIG